MGFGEGCALHCPDIGVYRVMCIWLRSSIRLFGSTFEKALIAAWQSLAGAGCGDRIRWRRHSGRKTKPTRLVAFVLLIGATIPAQAFEENGHNMVAQLMMPFLKDNAKAELERLYGEDWNRELISRAAMVQSELDRPKNKHLLPLQQTLFEEGDTAFDPARHCPNNACSVAAILESRQVLLRTNYSDPDKRQAILYLMHYMLQMHIPVNSGLMRDEGGRKIYLKDDELQPVNFAWIWNHDLYRRQGKRWFSYAQELYREIQEMNPSDWISTMSVEDWAFETHQIAVEEAYPHAAMGRYSADMMNDGIETLERQLMKAAYRTAALLNETFGDEVMSESDG